jgi:preprotein translocase subunit Sss1
MPFTIQSTNTSEQPIITQIHFTQENTIAFIDYEIEINGENLTFTTQITVGPKPSQEEKPADTTLVMIIIGICIIAVIGYMIYSQMKYRRR